MITLSVLALIYFLPTIVAARQGHDVAPILRLNLFFGWTVIGSLRCCFGRCWLVRDIGLLPCRRLTTILMRARASSFFPDLYS